MYVVYSICLYFLSIFLFTYNKNHLSKKKHSYAQIMVNSNLDRHDSITSLI